MSTEEAKPNRYGLWFSLAAFSVIALVSFTSDIPGSEDLSDQSKQFKWGVSVSAISLAFSAMAVFAHALIREKFVGTTLEGGMSVILLAFWCAGLPAIMDPDNTLAQEGAGTVNNANLYFFTWGSFLMALFIFGGYLRDVHNVGTGKTEFMPTMWLALLAASVVVMAASTRSYKNINCDQSELDGTDICKRLKFGVGGGVISLVLAFLSILMAKWVPVWCDAILSIIVMVIWIFGIIYLTFGNTGQAPAKELGNLYFSTWASFVAAAGLGGNAAKLLWAMIFGKKEEETASPVTGEKKEMKDEAQVVEEGELEGEPNQ